MKYITGKTGEWEYVIGLEVHAQITSNSKLFSSSATNFGAAPNSQVSLLDAGMPGMLPVLNSYCVEQAIKTGIALNAQINEYSVFDRKNYFYPDLPTGYQISQFYYPIVQNGYVDVILEDGTKKTIRVNRLHIEQDAGKSIHDQSDDYSFIDLNRAGIGLMEIVTEPDITSPYEAGEYVKKLRHLLRSVGTCDGDMEKGSLRCDANISVRKKGITELGTRCEIKNLNSIRNIVKAIEFEASRQIDLLEDGKQIVQETRLFDTDRGVTVTMRLKEDANDYRYFPDPDLLPLIVSQELIARIRDNMPELPDAKIARYIDKFGLNAYDAEVIINNDEASEYYETAAKIANPKLVANWVISELFGYLNNHDISLNECKITPQMLGDLVNMIENGTISGKIAKIVFDDMFMTGSQPEVIIEQKSLVQVSDERVLVNIIQEVIEQSPTQLADYRSGKDRLFGFFVGQVMKKTEGKANPSKVNDLLKKYLDEA